MSKKKSKSVPEPKESITSPSNLISLLRMVLVIPLFFLFSSPKTNQLAIAGLCFFAWMTDLADGWIARQFGGETKLGRIIDPLADKVYIIIFVLLLTTSGMLPLWYTLVVIARDVIIFSGGMYLRKKTGQLVQSNMLGKATVVSIGFTLLAALFSDGGTDVLFTSLMIVSLGLIFVSLYVYGERFMKLLKTSAKN
ncbi:MAG: CDP-alcohol phosphatidyltransferase family protein [Bacteroidota bacterium]